MPYPPARMHFAFLLLDQFTMLAFTNAVEVLRMANQLLDQPVYEWSLISSQGGVVYASNGVPFETVAYHTIDVPDVVLACGGTHVEEAVGSAEIAVLHEFANKSCVVGSLCTGSYALVKAELLNGYFCTSHWENLTVLRKNYPLVEFSQDLFVIDRDRWTCAGGIASLDMMLYVITANVGKKIATSIADQFILSRVRDKNDEQRVPLEVRMQSLPPILFEVVALMENNLEEPLTLDELAHFSHTSARHLQRLFKKYLHTSPSQHYIALRLRKAKELLRHTNWSLAQIALKCGFQSAGHFSKSYREVFKMPPSTERHMSDIEKNAPVIDYEAAQCIA